MGTGSAVVHPLREISAGPVVSENICPVRFGRWLGHLQFAFFIIDYLVYFHKLQSKPVHGKITPKAKSEIS